MILRSAMGVKALVHRGFVTLATELRNPPSVILRTARYDRSQQAYVPVEDDDDGGSLTLSLAANEHVAALENVGCRKVGLMRTFLALATRESITIGMLDIGNSTYEATGKIWLPKEDEYLQCWLADGPTLIVRYQSKLVVASKRQEHTLPYLEFEGHGCPKWKADMLVGSFERVFVAGNQVLCVHCASASDSGHAGLVNFSLPSEDQVGRYSPALAKVQLPLELDPCFITCVAYVRSTFSLPYELVLGTSDGRLKCCSREKVITDITLEDSPLSVQFGEAAHGEPVLIVSLSGMDRKVVTFFADSLHLIHSWTGVQQVVVDDLTNVGHDQILLVTQPLSSTASFEHCRCISLLESGPQVPGEEHKSKILKSVTKALEIRLQEGVKELQEAEQRRLDKMRMLTDACNLMQSVAVKQGASKIGDMDVPDDAVYMESVHFQEVYMGKCFLIINIHVNKDAPQGFHLRRPTLFATSLRGSVRSMASCLPSQGNAQRFLFSFPMKECHVPLHIILAAEISVDKSLSSAWDPVEVNSCAQGSEIDKASRIYTQWVHTIEAPPVAESNVAGSVVGNLRAVCEKWVSHMGGAFCQEHFISALVRAVALQTDSDNRTWISQSSFKEGERHYVTEEHTKAPLTSMYAQDISLVKKNGGLTNFLGTLSKLYGPKLAEMVTQFADVLLEEIQSCVNEGPEFNFAELQAAADRCFCHMLSSITYNSFGHF